MKENCRAVLRAEVWPLAVNLGRVMRLPERIEQLFVTHFRRVERNLHHFCVPSFIRANIFVARIRLLSAAVACRSIDHSRYALKRRLYSPEAPCSKCRCICHWILLARRTLDNFFAPVLDARSRCLDSARNLGLLPR